MMMKKLLFLLVGFLLLGSQKTMADKEVIPLTVGIVDNKPAIPGKSKAPVRIPVIYLDGYTLSLSHFHPEYTVNVMQDDEVVYSSVIPAGVTEHEFGCLKSVMKVH